MQRLCGGLTQRVVDLFGRPTWVPSAVRAPQPLTKRPRHDPLDLRASAGRRCGLYALNRHCL